MAKKDLLKKMKLAAKILAVSMAGYTTPAASQTPSSETNGNPNKQTLVQHPENPVFPTADEENLPTDTTRIKLKFEDINEISPLQAVFGHSYDYIINLDTWRNKKELDIKRVDGREITTPDLTSVMIRRECGTFAPYQIKDGSAVNPSEIPEHLSQREYHQYLQDANNLTAAQINNAVNINSAKTRCFICQADVTCTKFALRYMYCSNNENVRRFAAQFIEDTEANRDIAKQIANMLYDSRTQDFRLDEKAIQDRYLACCKMENLKVKNISPNGRTLSEKFIKELKNFDAEYHNDLMNAEKDFVVAIYPLANKKNIPAAKAQKLAEQKGLRDASCLKMGIPALNTASLIARGTFSTGTLNETKVLKNAQKINEVNYATLPALRQMAIAGYQGADNLYTQAKEYIHQDKDHIQQKIDDLTKVDISIKNDVIQAPKFIPTDLKIKSVDMNLFLQNKKKQR